MNFIGGISVGDDPPWYGLSSALSTYTMLTIGDGCLSPRSRIVDCDWCRFYVVTRVNGDSDNMETGTIS